MRILYLPVVVLAITACSEKKLPVNKFDDPAIVKIFDFKDRRMTDSVVVSLKSQNVIYRREAALALASIQDSSASLVLGTALLEDPDLEVQRNAAFALGQTGGTQAVNALIPAIKNKDKKVVREVLEALGKTLQSPDVRALSDLQSNDSTLQEGLAWAFYHLGTRKKADSIITKKVAAFLEKKYSYQTRLAAAFYFARSQKVEGVSFHNKLIAAAQHDANADVRMTAANGLRHLESAEAIFIIKEIMQSEKDERVRINALKACLPFALKDSEELLFSALNDQSDMVKVTASEVIRSKAEVEHPFKDILTPAQDSKNPRVTNNLIAAALKTGLKVDILNENLVKKMSKATYVKSMYLSAISEALWSGQSDAFDFISKQLLNPKNEKVIMTAAASALVHLNQNLGKKTGKKGGTFTQKNTLTQNEEVVLTSRHFLKVYKEAIAIGDEAVIGIIAMALVNPDLHYKEEIKDLRFLYDAMSKFKLPKDIESLQPLENAIAYLEGREKPVQLKNAFNHPIVWDSVKMIPVDQQVKIQTTKGDIFLKMIVEETPGSTFNFISLVRSKYFDGKFFHRVVPNFVIQTGCNRGDGYGSEDYSIRSEFSLRRYTTGSVGIASAGKDTEGTQWFITHSPTPHLNGRYTIFAETVSGMDVVDKIEVGDKILKVTLITGDKK